MLVLRPRYAWRLLRALVRLVGFGADRVLVTRARRRRRRRAVAMRSFAAPVQRFARPHHIYDELY
jgi:hypothetical protein